jgi:site-specific DNA recombinase
MNQIPELASGKRALIYLRVSSQGQVDTDYDPEGNSIPAQRKACQRKAAELGAEIVDEYVDPGRSALEIKNRPEFQKMMARIRNQKDVDYIIVYARSRMHRNATDALLTRRELKDLGITLVSIRDYTDDSDMGDMIGTILDAVNEYQSKASGADIAFKMEAKAKNGGTPGRAKLGYANVTEEVDGRTVNTVVVDHERAPYVQMGFKLYATGNHSFKELRQALTEAGLRTRPSKKYPTGRVISINKIGRMLRDRYYLGYVTHKGQEYQGRHEALIEPDLFERVQQVLYTQRGAGVRERAYDHPQKGALTCGRCGGRLYLDGSKKHSRNTVYFYFFCLGVRDGSCDLPRMSADQVQAAVEDHYTTLQIPEPIAKRIHGLLNTDARERQQTDRSLRRSLKLERTRLQEQQRQFLDLVGNPLWPTDMLNEKMQEQSDRIANIDTRLADTENDVVSSAGEAIRFLLELLEDPRTLFRRLTEHGQRRLTQTCFAELVVDADDDTAAPFVISDRLKNPIAPLLGGYEKRQRAYHPLASARFSKATCPNSDLLVELRGFEPLTFSMPWKRATNCAKAP